MGLRLVNTHPGHAVEPMRPGQPVQYGLKSETASVDLGSLRVTLGLTSIHHEGLLPESNPNLPARGAAVGVETVERSRPADGQVLRSADSGLLTFAKVTDSQDDVGIYEVSCPIRTNAPVLAYFQFLTNPSWTLTTRPWSAEPVAGVYLGLEHGNYNNACYAFLGDGVLHAGGVLQNWDETRPGHEALAFDWKALPAGTRLGIWIYYNIYGYPEPFSPRYTPVAEVWTSIDGGLPTRQCRIPVGTLGTFPKPPGGTPNTREAPSDLARVFFGFMGNAGESLTLTDWALFPDYRVGVNEGTILPKHSFNVLPDGPCEYRAESGLPTEVFPGRWLHLSDVGAVAAPALFAYAPGHKKTPSSLYLKKTSSKMSGFEKKEPRLESQQGFMFEAFMAGQQSVRVADQFGAGFLVDDSHHSCRVSLLEDSTGKKTIGLLVQPSPDDAWAYLQSPEFDWTSLTKVRVVGDYLRMKAGFFVEDSLIGEVDLASMPASAASEGRVAFGHLSETKSEGDLQISFINYLSRYKAWEGRDGLLPSAAPVAFTKTEGGEVSETMSGSKLLLSKKSFGAPDTRLYYSRAEDFEETNGTLVDFSARVVGYTSRQGLSFAANCWTGSGLELLLGSKKLHLGFFDCGTFGRKIGIIPGSGSEADIIKQTALGKAFSASIDWTQPHSYRLVYKAYDRIELWADNVAGQSLLSVPWGPNGFDLPDDFSPAAIRFGHFDYHTSSETEWHFLRFGQSNGFEVSLAQKFDEMPSYLFGGRVVATVEFAE